MSPAKHRAGQPDGPPGLVAEGIEVRYGSVRAVAGVDLRIGAGEVVAVTGPSGAGKTSLLGALAGIVTPNAGRVQIDGREPASSDDRALALIPQGNALVRVMTAAENVAVAGLLRGLDGAGAAEVAVATLAAVGMAEATEQLIEELSGGQQQRVAVARGLAARARVLLADEPTSELDAATRNVVLGLLRAEADRGAAVAMATHDPEAAAQCDAELRLDEGVATWVRDDRAAAAALSLGRDVDGA